MPLLLLLARLRCRSRWGCRLRLLPRIALVANGLPSIIAAGLAGRALLHRLSLVHSTVLLAYLGSLADAVAEVVEPGAPDGAATRDLDGLDPGRVHGEDALDAYPTGDAPDGEVPPAGLTATDLQDRALEDLSPLALTLPHAVVHPHGIPRPHVGQGSLPRLFLLKFSDDIH